LSYDLDAYYRDLGVCLTFSVNSASHLGRLAELCNKTNQFNLALRRFGQLDLDRCIASSAQALVGVHLSDRLTDSGIIGVLVVSCSGSDLLVQELCISCRALGRKLEDEIILGALKRLPWFSECERVVFQFERGPRNGPAAEWLGRWVDTGTPGEAGGYPVSAERLRRFEFNVAVERVDMPAGGVK